MLATEDLLVYCYTLTDDLIRAGQVLIPPRPGPVPACTDAEVITIALVRQLLGRRSEAAFVAEITADYPGWFPHLPHRSEVNRRTRWLWGAFEQIRTALITSMACDEYAQVDTSALPVMHPSRKRGPDAWVGPNALVAGFGRDAAHGEWFYGFRLAAITAFGSRVVLAWAIVPAAVNERELVPQLLEALAGEHQLRALREVLADRGFTGRALREQLAEAGICLLTPPSRAERKRWPADLVRLIARCRNRIETTFGEITERMDLARHGAHTFWGLLTRTAAAIAAHTVAKTVLATV